MQNAEQSGVKNRDKSRSNNSSVKKSSLVNQSNSKALHKQQQQQSSSSNSNSSNSGSGNNCASVSASGGSNRSGSGVHGVSGSGTTAKGNNPKQQQQNNLCRVQPEVGVSAGSASFGAVSNNSREVNNAKTMSTAATTTATTGNSGSSSGAPGGRQSSSQHSSPAKSDTETTFSEFQPRVSDSSESDEESVSEVKFVEKKIMNGKKFSRIERERSRFGFSLAPSSSSNNNGSSVIFFLWGLACFVGLLQ